MNCFREKQAGQSTLYIEKLSTYLLVEHGSLTGKGFTHIANESDYNIDFQKMESIEISAGDFVTLKENIITIYRSNRTLQASTDMNTLDNKKEIGFSFEEATIHNLHLLHSLKCANSL